MYFSVLLLTTFLYALTASSTPCHNPKSRPTVTIDSGAIAGTVACLPSSSRSVNKFLGIPFAAPPVRFKAPQPVTPWRRTYDASKYKPACLQQFNYPEAVRNESIRWFNTPPPPAGESEDCLNLNVFAPASSYRSPKTVMVWIHGGSYLFGSGSLHLYDGSSLAANQDVVVVTINYRTNLFGFPGSPELPAAEKNLGLLDQRFALDWVRRNIAAFGGDPEKITIFGESAGGGSVDGLITAPPEPVPFRAAIMQSGQSTIRALDPDPAVAWKKLLDVTRCSSSNDALECVRAVPALELKEIIERQQLVFGPTPDGGVTWADSPRKRRLDSADQKSLIARVPVLMGSNADEALPFAAGMNDTEGFLRGYLLGVPEKTIQNILNTYPIGSPGISDESHRLSAILTDFSFQCPARLDTDDSAAAGIDVWRYYFNASFPNTELAEGGGAYHGLEVYSIFGTYPQEGATKFQIEVGKGMQEAWANFAKNPNKGPGWEKVPQLGVFGGGARTGTGDEDRKVLETIDSKDVDARCSVWDELYNASS
ncbi:carboxylesterase [Histoplasma capsulatum G186AR]|uniref:Carboxylic ester hydrolase n=2 Tax=Ajellomyces capsulatus TaxID=5037 RepID=C0NA63_AJECG|nr:carboxylesterase [Histoplasma capsulatum G186AR]EEH10554.1 carboxylesterase [Histoplasma capsulatum G186AR]KAG5288439.1 carboxylesterase [Histoplasma capsulatum]QSS71015.1 carboxylesterase [Histoplasma capsulatum G186AR]